MPLPVTAASLSTADAGYIENDDEPWHSTCVSKAPVITKGAFDQAYVSSLPFVAPEEALQLAMSSPTLKLKDIDGAIAKCIADGGRKGCPAIVAAEKIKKAADKDGNVKPGKAPGGPAQAAGWDAMKREVVALLALVVVLLVVVGALIIYLVPWRRRAAFASPSLSVELNPTTYNELRRGSSVVEGI